MNREDVQALRARVLREANNVAGHGVNLADMTFSVEGDTLEALCRAWLALDSAPVGRLDIGRNDFDDTDMVEIVIDPNHVSHLQYRRVCLVPEDGQGGGDG